MDMAFGIGQRQAGRAGVVSLRQPDIALHHLQSCS